MMPGSQLSRPSKRSSMAAVHQLHRLFHARIFSRLAGSSQLTRSFTLHRPLNNEPEGESEKSEPEDRGNKTSLVGMPYVEIDPDTSIRYVNSQAYQTTYGDDPVWHHYRRNFKGRTAPRTRKRCVRAGVYGTGNPCPICRDNHLVPYYKNVKLLKQFISPYTGQVLDSYDTGICQRQHKNILVAVEQAWDYGLIDMPFPKRVYDYKDYYGDLMNDKNTSDNVNATKDILGIPVGGDDILTADVTILHKQVSGLPNATCGHFLGKNCRKYDKTMPKRQKQTKEDKILDCERPPPGLTLASFLDDQIASKTVADEYAAAEDSATNDDVTSSDGATAAPAGPTFTIRKNKKGNLPISYENRNKGKKVTVISNVSGDASSLVSELKRLTGTGGVQKGECIELQGDRRDFLTKFLKGHPCVVQR